MFSYFNLYLAIFGLMKNSFSYPALFFTILYWIYFLTGLMNGSMLEDFGMHMSSFLFFAWKLYIITIIILKVH